MSAFDRLQNYSATNKTVESEVFDVKTPQGCFLNKLHSQGYKMYEYEYTNSKGTTLSILEQAIFSTTNKGSRACIITLLGELAKLAPALISSS